MFCIDDVYMYKSLHINFLFCSVLSLLLTAVGATAGLTPSTISVFTFILFNVLPLLVQKGMLVIKVESNMYSFQRIFIYSLGVFE